MNHIETQDVWGVSPWLRFRGLPALFKHPLAGMLSLVLHQFGKLPYSPWFGFYRTNG